MQGLPREGEEIDDSTDALICFAIVSLAFGLGIASAAVIAVSALRFLEVIP